MSELKRNLIEDIFYPPHEPRKASAIYKKTHKKLIYEMDEPCWICGIKNSMGGKMETHHAHLEWAAASAFEDNKEMLAAISKDFEEIMNDPLRLREWLDSEGNMLVLCDKHHRGSRTGIHMISYPAWVLQKYQVKDGFVFIEQ